jgi:hypothetical protein
LVGDFFRDEAIGLHSLNLGALPLFGLLLPGLLFRDKRLNARLVEALNVV